MSYIMFRRVTRAQYNALTPKNENTQYLIQETNNTLSLALGTLILSAGIPDDDTTIARLNKAQTFTEIQTLKEQFFDDLFYNTSETKVKLILDSGADTHDYYFDIDNDRTIRFIYLNYDDNLVYNENHKIVGWSFLDKRDRNYIEPTTTENNKDTQFWVDKNY